MVYTDGKGARRTHWTLCVHARVMFAGVLCRNLTLEAACSSALDAQYGRAAAAIIRSRLMEHPSRLAINKLWDSKVDGESGVAQQACRRQVRRAQNEELHGSCMQVQQMTELA